MKESPVDNTAQAIQREEDEQDLKAYREAYAEYKANPKTYSLAEVEQELRRQRR